MNAKIKQYNSLDLMKFISAILIIVLHTSPFQSYNALISFGLRNVVTIIAVPFFFCTSGFLLFKKLSVLSQEEKGKYFKHYIKRLCIMYGLWSLVYFPFVIYNWTKDGFSVMSVLQYIKRFFFEGSYSTIWFLPALIVSATVCYFLHKKLPFGKIVLTAFPFYAIACLMTNYYGITAKIPVLGAMMNVYYSFFDSVKNGILFGFVFVALGGAMSEFKETKSVAYRVFGCIISGVLLTAESVLPVVLKYKQYGCDTKLFLLPFTFFLMAFLLRIDLKDGKAYIYMRKISLMLFLSQRIFISLAEIFLADTIFVKNSMLYFVMILGSSWLFSDLFIRAAGKIKFLKYFC